MTTVVVPAHDEEAVIGRCLRTLLDGARPEEVRVVVVANGTSDRTLEVARAAAAEAGHEVETLDLPEPSKIAAVRAGMARADGAVVVLDADVQLPTATLRALARALDTDDPVVAAPTMRVDTSGASWPVRRYYRAWTALPYVASSMVGSGVFALNRAARDRVGVLPDVTNDDGWVRRSFAPAERVVVPEPFTVHASRSVAALVARRARIVNGNRDLDRALGGRDEGRNGLGALLRLVRARRVGVLDALAFVAVTLAARAVAARRRARRDDGWYADATTRVAA
jgi:glycosyltransferase involved in cell wall biosynthesis